MKLKNKKKKKNIEELYEKYLKEYFEFIEERERRCSQSYCNYLMVGEQTAKILKEKYGWE